MAEADVFDDGPAKEPNMAAGHKPLVNENPRNLVEIFYAGIGFIEAYGWLIIFGLIFVMVLWTNISKPLKKFFQGSKVPYNRDVTDSMTTEQVEARMVAMDKARQKMQDRYNEQATKMSAKRKEVEEQKRLQKISDHDALMSGKTQSSTHHKMEQKTVQETSQQNVIKRNKDAKSLRRSDDGPLSRGSSNDSCRWRPGSSRPSAGG